MPIAALVLAVIVIGGGTFFYIQNDGNPSATRTEETNTEDNVMADDTSSEPADSENVMASTYTDGTYTKVATYRTPRNVAHDISVTLTLEGGIVTSADVRYNGIEAETSMHQNFESAWEPVVVGESLDSVTLSRVGGASLTSQAFNEAVAEIKVEAAEA